MATVRVTSTLADLEGDLLAGATIGKAGMPVIVQRNVEQGNELARRFARDSAGPHGANYFKRISAEMTGALEGEWGPHGDVVENAVGAGWRGGPVNTDLPRSADIQGRKAAEDARDLLDRMFWP